MGRLAVSSKVAGYRDCVVGSMVCEDIATEGYYLVGIDGRNLRVFTTEGEAVEYAKHYSYGIKAVLSNVVYIRTRRNGELVVHSAWSGGTVLS